MPRSKLARGRAVGAIGVAFQPRALVLTMLTASYVWPTGTPR